MRSLAIYTLLASAATLVTAGPVNAKKAAEGESDLSRLDQLIRSYQQGSNIRAEEPPLLPIDRSNTTITQIITPTVGKPGATQQPVPPLSQTSPRATSPNPPQRGRTSSVPDIPDHESAPLPTTSNPPVIPSPPAVPVPSSSNTSTSKSEGIQISFITITSLQPAETVTKTEKASTVTVTVSRDSDNNDHAAPHSSVSKTGTAPAAGETKAPPLSHAVPPHSTPRVIEATTNKDGNGVGVSIISIYSPSIPAETVHPAPSSSLPPPPPPPPPPAAEIGKPPSSSSQVPLPAAPPPAAPPVSSSVPAPTTASSSSSSPAESSLSTPASTSSSTRPAPDASAPLESAVQGKPSVIAPTSTTNTAPPAATDPPPLPIDLSGFTLSSLLDLGNLMITATAEPDAAAT